MANTEKVNGSYIAGMRTQEMLRKVYETGWELYSRGMKFAGSTEEEQNADRESKKREFMKGIIGQLSIGGNRYAEIARTNWHEVTSSVKKIRNTQEATLEQINAYRYLQSNGVINKMLDTLMLDPLELKKQQSGKEVMEGVLAFNEALNFTSTKEYAVFGDLNEEREAFRNIFDKAERFIEYDLEGIGDHITQYAFGTVDFGKNLGAELKIEKNAMVAGVVGLDAKIQNRILELIQQYRDQNEMRTGWKGFDNDKYLYAVDEMVKFALGSWKYDEKTGTAKLLSYGSDEDVNKIRGDRKRYFDLAEKAAVDLGKLWGKQTSKLFDYEYGGKTYKVYGFEKEIFDQIRKGLRSENGLTMVSTNAMGYDNRQFEAAFGFGGWGSRGGQALFAAWSGNSGSMQQATNQLDMTSIGRALKNSGTVLSHGMEAALAQSMGQKFNSSTGNTLVYSGGQAGLEAINKKVDERVGAGVKHAAEADVYVQGETHVDMLLKFRDLAKGYVERQNAKIEARNATLNSNPALEPLKDDESIFAFAGSHHKAQKGSEFFITNGQFRDMYGSFVYDETSGEFRYAGHARIDANGVVRPDIVSHGSKKGTLAVLLSDVTRFQFDPNNPESAKALEMFQQTGAVLPGTDLYAYRFGLVGDNGKTRKTYVRIGTREQIRNILQNQRYAGDFSRELYAGLPQIDIIEEGKAAAQKAYRDALDNNAKAIHQAYKAGLVSKQVVDAVDRLDYDALTTSVELAKEKEAHRKTYEAERKKILKNLGLTEGELPDYETAVAQDTDELWKQYKEAKHAAWAAGKDRKSAKEKWDKDSARKQIDEAVKDKKSLKQKRDEIKSELSDVREKLQQELKKPKGQRDQWLVSDYNDIISDREILLSQAEEALRDAEENTSNLIADYRDNNENYRMFVDRQQSKLAELRLVEDKRAGIHWVANQAYKAHLAKLKPLFDLEEREAQWRSDFRKKVDESRIIYKAPDISVNTASDPTKNFTEKQWEEAMLSVEGQRAVDHSKMDSREVHGLATPHMKDDGTVYYKIDNVDLAKRSEKVLESETAGNWLREMDVKKARNIIALTRASNEFASKFFNLNSSVLDAQQREQTMEYVLDAYRHGAKASFYGKLSGTQKQAYDALTRKINSVMRGNKNPMYDRYPNFIQNFTRSFGWAQQMETILSITTKAAKQHASGSSIDAQDFAFQQIYPGVLAALRQEANSLITAKNRSRKNDEPYLRLFNLDDALGRSISGLKMTREEEDSFEIDIGSILSGGKMEKVVQAGSKTENLFSVKLGVQESFGARLASTLGFDKNKIQDVMHGLHLLGAAIVDQYGAGDTEEDEKLRKALHPLSRPDELPYAQEYLQTAIVDKLKKIRKNNPEAGRPAAIRLMMTDAAPLTVQYLRQEFSKEDWNTSEEKLAKTVQSATDEITGSASFTKFDQERRKPKDLAETIANRLFEGTADVDLKKLEAAGYSEDEANRILERRGRRYDDTKKFLEILFENTYGHNSHVGYSYSEKGPFHFELFDSSGDRIDITHLLPFDEFDEKTGHFSTRVGGRHIATLQEFSLGLGKEEDIYGARSLVNAYARALLKEVSKFNSPHRSDKQNLKNFDVFARQALDEIVDRSFTKFDEQDLRQSSYFDLMPFFKRLGYFAANGGFMDENGKVRDLSEKMRELLWDMQERYRKNNQEATEALVEEVKVSNTDLQTIMSDLPRLLMPLRDPNSKLTQLVFGTSQEAWKSFQNVLDHISTLGLRDPANGLVSLTDTNLPFMSYMGNDGRHMGNVFQRAHILQNVSSFKDEMKSLEEERKLLGKNAKLGIAEMTRFDSVVLTSEESARRAAGLDITKVFRTVRVSLTQKRLEEALATKGAQDVMEKLGISSSQFFTYIGESGSIMSPFYLGFFSKNIEQKQLADNALDPKTLLTRTRKNGVPGEENAVYDRQAKISNATAWNVESDAKNGFKIRYSNEDVLVKENEAFMYLEDFNGNPQAVKAVRTGFLTRRFYDSSGAEATEAEINSVLAKHADHLAEIQKNAPDTMSTTVRDILKRAGYNDKFAVESIDALPYRKVGLDAEKSYAKFLMPALGRMLNSVLPEILNDGAFSNEEERNAYIRKMEAALPAFLSPSAYKTANRLQMVLESSGLDTNGKLDLERYDKFIKNFRSDTADLWSGMERALVKGGLLEEGQHAGVITATENEAIKGSHAELLKTSGKINEAVEFLARAKAKAAGFDAPEEEHYRAASTQIRKEFDDAKVFADAGGNSVIKGRNVGELAIDGHGGESFEIGLVQDFNKEAFTDIMAKYHPDFAREKSGDAYGFQDGSGVRIDKVRNGIAHAYVEGQDIGAVYHYNNDGNVDVKYGIAEVRSLDDADQGRTNKGGEGGLKMSRRVFVAAEEDTFDLPGLEKTMRAMERFEKANVGSGYDAEKMFNEQYEGIATAKRNAEGHLEIASTGRKAVDSDGNVREVQLRDMKVNAPVIQNLKEEVIAGTQPSLQFKGGEADENLYRQLDNIGISRSKAEAIVKGYNAGGFDVVGMDTVKNQYAYVSGQASIAFNRDIQKAKTEEEKQSVLKRYMDSGFFGSNVIDINNLSLDKSAGSTTDMNNLLERGGIIRIGEDYVAVGFQPAQIMDNEEHVGMKSASELRKSIGEMKQRYDYLVSQGYSAKSAGRIAQLDQQLGDAIENVREGVISSVGSKGGAIEAVTSGYLPNSGMRKGGIIRTENGEVADDLNWENQDDVKRKLETSVSKNQLLRDYSVDGASLAEHLKSGHRVNAVFVGKDYFENIVKNGGEFRQALAAIKGYKSVDEITLEDENAALEKVLEAAKKGSIGIGFRQPAEYEGSIQSMHVFYNANIATNELVMTESAAAAMKLDKDGDIAYLNALREQADLIVNGKGVAGKDIPDTSKIRLSGIDASAIQAIADDAGVDIDIQFRDPSVFRKAVGSADMSANATQSHRYRADYDRKHGVDQDMDEATRGMPKLEEIEVGGHNYSIVGLNDTQRTKYLHDYENVVKSDDFQQFYQGYVGNLEEKKRPTEEALAQIQKAENGTASMLVESGAADAYLAQYKQSHTEDEARSVREAFGYQAAAEANATAMAKEIARGDAGLNNTDTFRFKEVVARLQDEGLTNYQAGDQHIVSHLMEHWNDAYQATKNSTATGMFTQQEASNAMRAFFGVNAQHRRDTKPLLDLVKFMYENGGIKELAHVPAGEGIEYDEKGMISLERLEQAVSNILPQNRALNKDWYEEFRVGFAMSPKAPQFAESDNSMDLKGTADRIANEMLPEEAKLKSNVPITVESDRFYDRKSFGLDEDVVSGAVEDTIGDDIGNIAQSAFRNAGEVLGHGGAKAMLGFAGAMMMAGMAGGAPTSPTPAQGQAQGIQSENAMYSIPSATPAAGKSQPQSYVINVNASTSRGRDFATAAINQAFARMQGVPAGNQMTMNIKDSSNNIGFGDIANYVQGML